METPKIFTEHPRDGGSYIANPDGTFTQREPTTGERPCGCRPESLAPAPAAAVETQDAPDAEPEPAVETRRERAAKRAT